MNEVFFNKYWNKVLNENKFIYFKQQLAYLS